MKNTENNSLYGHFVEVKFCKKCPLSNQRLNSTVEFTSESKVKNKEYKFRN